MEKKDIYHDASEKHIDNSVYSEFEYTFIVVKCGLNKKKQKKT